MKLKLTLPLIFLLLIVALYGFVDGWFSPKPKEYASLKIPEVVDYNFHIKPILSDNCYTCHGPDANKRKAGLRLDIEETAFKELTESSGYALVKGKPHKSKVYEVIVSDDPKVIMPPVDSNLSLSAYEKDLIKKWIEQGAEFEKHWAYIVPEKEELPQSEASDWGNNEIDAFILEKLEEKGLQPSEKASDEILIRRISLDVTGLPPSPEMVEKLMKDSSEERIEKVIDAFLASPAYGERMTQSWLDVARYADSHGYQDDSYRTMWPWRDWVIHAFNSNLPYDDFLTWQIAGDLLPNATKEQVLATAFNRNHPLPKRVGLFKKNIG